MPTSHDVFFEGPHPDARRRIDETLIAQGFTLSSNPDGSTRASRGALVTSLALRAFAGRSALLTLAVQYFVDERGRLVARVLNEPAASLLGGPIGLIRSQGAVSRVVSALEAASAAGPPARTPIDTDGG